MNDADFLLELYGGLNSSTGHLILWTFPARKTLPVPLTRLHEAHTWASSLAKSENVYFGLGLLSSPPTGSSRGKADDVIGLPCLWMDADVKGPTHKCLELPPTREEAARLFHPSVFPLNPTGFVDSGGGYQVYWLFDRPWIFGDEAERTAAADLLKRFQQVFIREAASRGWKIDNTADLARVLRVPGTFNRKSGDPVPVKVYWWGGKRYAIEELRAAVDAVFPPAPSKPARAKAPRTFERTGNGSAHHDDLPPAMIAPILNGCAWLRHCHAEAAELPEPEWYAALGIVGRCEGGEDLAHEWSRAYPGYSEEETTKKLAHAVTSAGPRTCKNIRDECNAEAFCSVCPNWGVITSPIVLGAPCRQVDRTAYAAGRAAWPAPLEEAAFRGLAGDVVRLIEPHSEADPAALLIQFLVALGNVIGRGPYFVADGANHFTNLFAVIVGETAKARKGTSWARIRGLVAEAARHALTPPDSTWGDQRIMSGLSSGEGLISAVRDPVVRAKLSRDKKTGETTTEEVIEDAGVTDKRLMVVEGEFASVLRVIERDGNTLSPLIRQAWDTGNLRTMTKNPMSATGAHLSLVGHITAEELRRYLTRTEIANGLANRFVWVAARRSKKLPEGGNLDTTALAPYVQRLSAAISTSRTRGKLQRSDAARPLWWKVYDSLSEGHPGMLGAVTSRAEAQVMRLACVYALLDESHEIDVPHLMAALAVWNYCEASCRYIWGSTMGDPVGDAILDALRRNPDGMTRTEIASLFSRHHTGRVDAALNLLVSMGKARVEKVTTAGRPAERWFAV